MKIVGIDKQYYLYVSCCCCSVAQLCPTLRSHGLQHARLPCPSLTPEACSDSCPLGQMPSNHLILCCPLLLLPSIFPIIRVFSNESVLCIRWPEDWSFSFNFSLSNESVQFSSVQFSHSVVSDSLRPHESQHARPPCPSPTPGVHPNPCPLSQ